MRNVRTDGEGKKRRGQKSGEGMLSIDYYAYASGMRGWNPGFKVLFAVLLIIGGIAANSLYVSLLIFLVMMWLTVAKGGLELRCYLRLLTIPLVFILMSSIALAVNFSRTPQGDYSIHIWFFYIWATRESVFHTLLVVMKAFGAVSAMYMLSLSTPSTEIISVLRRVKVPGVVAELMYMIYRYIFILLDIQSRMTTAARSRLGYRNLRTSYLSFGHTLSNLLVLSLRRAGAYYDAMESRCYEGELEFLEDEKPLKKEQAVWAAVFLTVLCMVWFLTKTGA